ncbi:hypothetical protein [Paludibaculum fermentans]|uniref:hypothetical protein n=1 Tax=Paludibaculum fermentans TaxID=1473598 RepID=UPI003EB6D7AF
MRFLGRVLVVLGAMTLGSMLRADSFADRLYNTGVDGSHTLITTNALPDAHYSVVYNPPAATSAAYVMVVGWPVGTDWLGAEGNKSRWVRPTVPTGSDQPLPVVDLAGDYLFETTFSLWGFDPDTAVIDGQWASDNTGTKIFINGTEVKGGFGTGSPSNGFRKWTQFSILDGFVAGINKISFLVHNDVQATGNPAGLRVEFKTATAAVKVPEGANTLGLLLMAGGLLFLASRRERALRWK